MALCQLGDIGHHHRDDGAHVEGFTGGSTAVHLDAEGVRCTLGGGHPLGTVYVQASIASLNHYATVAVMG